MVNGVAPCPLVKVSYLKFIVSESIRIISNVSCIKFDVKSIMLINNDKIEKMLSSSQLAIIIIFV